MKEGDVSDSAKIIELETQLKKLQGIVLALVGLVVAVGILATFVPVNALLQSGEVVQAGEFQVVDDSGNVLVSLGQNEDGGVLQIYNTDGVNVITGLVNPGGAPDLQLGNIGYPGNFQLMSAIGTRAVHAWADSLHRGNLKVRDEAGHPAVGLDVTDTSGRISWLDPEGRLTGFLGANALGGWMAIYGPTDEGQRPRFFSGTSPFSGDGFLLVRDEKNSDIFKAATTADENETPYMFLRNDAGNEVFRVQVDSMGHGSLVVNDSEGAAKIISEVSSEFGSGGLKLRHGDGSLLMVASNVESPGSPVHGRPSLGLRNPGGERFFNALSLPDGSGRVSTYNIEGFPRFTGGTTQAGHGYVLLRNIDGKTTHFLGSENDSGLPVMDIKNAEGIAVIRAEVDSVTGNGILKTTTPDGTPVWSSEPGTGAGSGGDPGDGSAAGDGGGATSGLIGDFDGDGDVDFADFLTFAASFGSSLAG